MSTFGERLELLLKMKNEKKKDLAEKLSVSNAAISQFCADKNGPSRQTIRTISSIYGVNETWLLTGEGEMFAPPDQEQEVAQIVTRLYSSGQESFRYQLIKVLSSISDEKLAILEEIINELAGK